MILNEIFHPCFGKKKRLCKGWAHPQQAAMLGEAN